MTQNKNTYQRTVEDLATEARFDASEARERHPGLAGEVAALAILAAATRSPEASTLPTVAETRGEMNPAEKHEHGAA